MMTLREILDLDVLRRAEPEVAAGTSQLDRRVRWVHVTELPDIAYLLKGGELLLTTGVGLTGGTEQQLRYIRELAEVGVAGVIVELGRAFGELPAAMVREAERCELPLVALRREARFVEITETVHAAIINRQYELLQKAESIGRGFTELVLAGAGLGRILNRLAAVVGNPVVLEDAAHQVLEVATEARSVEAVLQTWERHSRSGHGESARGHVHRETGDPPCTWVGVWLRNEPWGRIHALEMDSTPDEMDPLALDRAAAAIGMALLLQRDAVRLADDARHSLVTDLLHGRYGAPTEVLRRAKSLGADLEDRDLVTLAVETVSTRAKDVPEAEHQRIRSRLMDEVRRAAMRDRRSALCGLEGNRVLAVVGTPAGRGADAAAEIAGALRASLTHGGVLVVVGASRASDVDSLQRALEEASEAVRCGVRAGGGATLYRFGDLGIDQLLLHLADGMELARFVESELRPLLNHDAHSSVPLLPTLRAYISHGGRKSPTARDLSIERRTLYHRLQKIGALLGRSVQDQEVLARVALALRGLDFLQSRTPR